MSRARILFIGPATPWQLDSGPSIRAEAVVKGLSIDGTVDVCLISDDSGDILHPPGYLEVRKASTVSRADEASTSSGGRRLFSRRRHRGGAATIADMAKSAGGRYDLIWASGAEAFLLAETTKSSILCDLSSQATYVEAPPALAYAAGLDGTRHMARRRLQSGGDDVERSLRSQIKNRSSATVVGSTIERADYPEFEARVIPYCYPSPPAAVGQREPHPRPSVGMVGGLTHDHGVEAALWMANEVFPRLALDLPGVKLRLIGRYDERLQELSERPGVIMTGWVENLRDELSKLDVVVNPRRSGWGNPTRVLEAFAHRIPVVATQIGAGGLDIEHGTHAFLTDDANEFAFSCLQAIEHRQARARVTVQAHQKWTERHTSEHTSKAVATLAAHRMFAKS